MPCFPSFFVFSVEAQTKAVAGKIVDTKDGSAIPGLTVTAVTASGKKVTAVTANDGTYKVSSSEVITKLLISGVGFEQQQVNVGANPSLNIAMSSTVSSLSDVVVVGYGTQKKKEITSAITRVSAEEFNKGNISNVAQLLQGKVAGLSIARPGGNPNEGFAIRLRGISTIGANTSPLVVVDGVVGADLNSIDPNDIKSIDVLKDGSAAAIYGTRGSAGVIIVTTKNGTRGNSAFNYSSQVTVENGARFTPHMNAAEYGSLIKTLGAGNNLGTSTDWNKAITRSAISHVHNLSFSGGNDKTTYDISMNYRNSEGIAINTGFQQLNGRVNLTHRALNDKLVLNVQMTATSREADLGFSNAFEYATIYNPTAPIRSTDPVYDLAKGGYFEQNATEYSNPVAMLEQNTNKQSIRKLNFAGSAEYEIMKGLKFLTRYAQSSSSAFISAYSPSNAFIDRGFYTGATGLGRHGYAWKQEDKSISHLYENTLTYTKKVSKLDVNAVAGYSYQEFTYQGFNAGGGNFVTDLSAESLGTAQDFQNGLGTLGSYKNASKLVAFFGRVNLNWDNFAYLSASIRQEGSTQFGPNNKWGVFPAVSGGIDLKRILKISDVVDALKLRASYGVTGSLPPYTGLSQLTFTGTGNYLINGNWITTYGPNQNQNEDLKWEKKAEIDFGADFALFNNRLTGTVDYFQRKTTDLIFNVTVPSPPALFNRAWKNVGDLEAKGFELALNYKVIPEGKLTWSTGVNYSTNKVTLTRLDPSAGSYIGETNLGSPGQEATKIVRTFEGGQVGTFWNAVYRGIDANGKYLFDDGKGNAVLSTATTYQTAIGNGLPKFELGWTNTFNYGNFDLNFFLRGSFGHNLINTFRAFYENPANAAIYNVVNTKYFNPKLNDASIFSSLFVEKGDFVKLDNATLGYTIPVSAKAKAAGVKSLRAYLAGQNLFCITDYTGADPEVRYADGGNILAPGIDRRSTWVMTRSFTLGINIGL